MEYSIVRVNASNYALFDDMVFLRVHGRDRSEAERLEIRNYDAVRETLKDKNLYVYAAQIGDRFVGWISTVYLPKVGRTGGTGHLYIDELWVDPGFRKRGIGGALMAMADALSESMGAMGLRLYVEVDNDRALSIYEKCGYVKSGQAYFMQKSGAIGR